MHCSRLRDGIRNFPKFVIYYLSTAAASFSDLSDLILMHADKCICHKSKRNLKNNFELSSMCNTAILKVRTI